jgi:hypothetical protein
LTADEQCFTIGQSNQSITDWKGGFDEAAMAVTRGIESGGSDFFNGVREPGEPAAAEMDSGKP